MKTKTKKIIKIIGSVIAGLIIGGLSFIILIMILFLAERNILLPLLCVSYLSIIIFLILINMKKAKKIYLLLLVPVVCTAAGMAVIRYYSNVRKMPAVTERRHFETTPLVRPGEESRLRLIDNLPVLDGATALYPVYGSFVKAVYPENEETWNNLVLCSRTEEAYNNLLKEKADIIFCAEPSETQLRQFNDKNITLKLVPIGREAFVFFVNKQNSVNNVTTDDIRGIYSGEIKNWKRLNGLNRSIRAFQRPKNSGSQTMLEKVMGNTVIMEPRMENIPAGMGDIINEVAVYRNFSNAIGYSFLFYSTEMIKNNQIKLLSIDGIYPSKETIQNNTYPFSDSFYAIYADTDEKNENITLFIDWILSEQGQELIERIGYTPIRD